jgi:hypothetical protein
MIAGLPYAQYGICSWSNVTPSDKEKIPRLTQKIHRTPLRMRTVNTAAKNTNTRLKVARSMSQIMNSKQPAKHHNMLAAMTAPGGRETGWRVSELSMADEPRFKIVSYAPGVKPITMSNLATSSPAFESGSGVKGTMTDSRAFGSRISLRTLSRSLRGSPRT